MVWFWMEFLHDMFHIFHLMFGTNYEKENETNTEGSAFHHFLCGGRFTNMDSTQTFFAHFHDNAAHNETEETQDLEDII